MPKATARLAMVVKSAGQPEPVTLWVNPRKDARFQSAVEENRVLTVHQETVGTKKDFAVVGFHKDKNVSYWVFPKPLDAFNHKRIIGIDYSLLKAPPLANAAEPPPKPKPAAPKTRPPAPAPAPVLSRFEIRVRCVSTVELNHQVEARNSREAKAKALAELTNTPVDFSRGQQSRKVLHVKAIGSTG